MDFSSTRITPTGFQFNTDLRGTRGYENTPNPVRAGRKLTQLGGCVRSSARPHVWIFATHAVSGKMNLRGALQTAP